MLGVAFVAEMLDRRVRTTESLESATGLSVLVQFKKDAKPLGLKMGEEDGGCDEAETPVAQGCAGSLAAFRLTRLALCE